MNKLKFNPIAKALRSAHLRAKVVQDKKAKLKAGYRKHKGRM